MEGSDALNGNVIQINWVWAGWMMGDDMHVIHVIDASAVGGVGLVCVQLYWKDLGIDLGRLQDLKAIS